MSDSLELLKRSAAPRVASARPLPPAGEDEDEAACPSFGYLRGLRERADNIEFRREREGDSLSFPYSWLGPKRYHPSLGIVLLFVGSEMYLVTLRGRNLNRLSEAGISLYERGILRHRVTWVREVQREESDALPEEECVVERIEVQAVPPEGAARAFGMEPVVSPGR
ncbi:MAG TPA: hypothetical protein VNK04_17615 [Gemmataceae bacterium]|nr:hypothetical protein [Gemmataceae bacterium]